MPQLPFSCYRDLVLLICFSDAILCLQAEFRLSFLYRRTGQEGFLTHPWASCIKIWGKPHVLCCLLPGGAAQRARMGAEGAPPWSALGKVAHPKAQATRFFVISILPKLPLIL